MADRVYVRSFNQPWERGVIFLGRERVTPGGHAIVVERAAKVESLRPPNGELLFQTLERRLAWDLDHCA